MRTGLSSGWCQSKICWPPRSGRCRFLATPSNGADGAIASGAAANWRKSHRFEETPALTPALFPRGEGEESAVLGNLDALWCVNHLMGTHVGGDRACGQRSPCRSISVAPGG